MDEKLHAMRHSTAHVLAAAVTELYPEVKLGVGPVVEDGFFYDMLLANPLTEEDLKKVEKKMGEIVKRGDEFRREEMPIDEAIKFFKKLNQDFKVELLTALKEKGTTYIRPEGVGDVGSAADKASVYYTGKFVDLCRGPHVKNSKEIGAFKLTKIAGAYWRGDEKNPQMQRVYGLCFKTKKELDAHVKMLEEAKKRDHRKLGKELGLFVFSELVGPGMPLFTPKGNMVRNAIIGYSRDLNARIGFQEVHTPNINKAELFKISGHYDKFKDDMLEVRSHYTDEQYFLKPMNCPQHTQIYASEGRSYRDLPLRFSDFANLYRDEKPGELSGLARLRCFAQDDGHIFCREDQIEAEFESVLHAIEEALKTYGLDYKIRLSLWDPGQKEKYLGDAKVWEKAQAVMRTLLQKNKIAFVEAPGEAAFYGPKMDIIAKDSIGREWQISTIQLDLNMPGRVGLVCTDKDGSEKTPVMIHRALVGSPDRFMGILIEHYAGAFPMWLAPVQVQLATVSEDFTPFAKKLLTELVEAGVRAELDDSDEKVGKKVRNAATMKIPWTVVVGEKEAKGGAFTVNVFRQEEDLTILAEAFIGKAVEAAKRYS